MSNLLIYLAMVVLSTYLGRMGMIIFDCANYHCLWIPVCFKTIVVIPEILHSDENWSSLVWLITFCFLVLLSATVNRLYKSQLPIAEKRSEEVIQSNKELSNIKANLEELVKQRTAEIHEKNQKLQASNEELC
ncbi:MAG: hypothetical protein R2759_16525 [Bacteroidales bacterium]